MRAVVVALLALIYTLPAHADKLIWIPTADVQLAHAEYMTRGDGDRDVITAQLGLGHYFELLGRRFHRPGRTDTEIGGQIQILPEGFATPGLALGVWDVANETDRGRRGFLVISQEIPGVRFLPTLIRGVRVHGGIGTGDLSGFFLGAQLKLPAGFSLVGETHRGDFDAGLWWTPVRIVSLKAESWNGDFFFGAQVSAPL